MNASYIASTVHNVKLPASTRLSALKRLLKMDDIAYESVISRYERLADVLDHQQLQPHLAFLELIIADPDIAPQTQFNIVMSMYVNDYFHVCYPMIIKIIKAGHIGRMYLGDLIKLLYANDGMIDQGKEYIIAECKIGDPVDEFHDYWYRFITAVYEHDAIRFSTISNITLSDDDPVFLEQLLNVYMDNPANTIQRRIQCAVMKLEMHHQDDPDTVAFLQLLIKHHYEDPSVVGDAYDALIGHHIDSTKWEQELIQYGSRNNVMGTYAENTQNVHLFRDQAYQYVDIIYARLLPTLTNRTSSPSAALKTMYEDFVSGIYNWILKFGCDENQETAIYQTIERFKDDRSRMGRHNLSLRDVAALVVSVIETDDQEKMFMNELIDMAGTCTTGNVVRLVGVVANGVDESPFAITYAQQIESNIKGRLFRNFKQEPTIYEIVTSEIIDDDGDRSDAYHKHVVAQLKLVYQELVDEFVLEQWIDKASFDEIFQAQARQWSMQFDIGDV